MGWVILYCCDTKSIARAMLIIQMARMARMAKMAKKERGAKEFRWPSGSDVSEKVLHKSVPQHLM